jgi:hypothetical protein
MTPQKLKAAVKELPKADQLTLKHMLSKHNHKTAGNFDVEAPTYIKDLRMFEVLLYNDAHDTIIDSFVFSSERSALVAIESIKQLNS